MTAYDPHAAWPEEYAAAMKRWQDCGHRCGCDELCSTGEDKAERMKDERGSVDALFLWVGSILVAFGALSIVWPLLVWLMLAASLMLTTVAVACVVVGGGRR